MKKIEPPFFKTQYNHDRNAESDASGLACKDPSLTQQQFAEEADINYIAEKFHLTGELPTPTNLMPLQGEFDDFDFRTAMDNINAANAAFMSYPASIRAYFENDPGKFLEFCSDPKNRDEAIRLGLVATPLATAQEEPRHGDPEQPDTTSKRTPTPKTPTKGTKPAQKEPEN